MKVIHLLNTSDNAHAFRLMLELVRNGVEVHVALPPECTPYDEYGREGIVTHPMDLSMTKLPKAAFALRKLVNDIKPDIIHSHFVSTTLIMRIGLRNMPIPRIFEVPGPSHLENPLIKNVEILLATKKDHWIATCKWTYNCYTEAGIDKSRLMQTFYGGDTECEIPPKGELRKAYGIPSNKFVVGMVSYIYPPKKWLGYRRGIKGHEDFIDAISILSEKYPDIIGVCIGGSWGEAADYEDEIHRYAESKRANIIFTGTLNNIPQLYPDIDCAVHPSHSENLGGAAESLLYGVPTVATNTGGFPDIVINKKTGLLAPKKNPVALAEAIEYMYLNRDFAFTSANEGRMLVKRILDYKVTSAAVLDYYHKILNNKLEN